jgi:hypothetical protein
MRVEEVIDDLLNHRITKQDAIYKLRAMLNEAYSEGKHLKEENSEEEK